MAITGNLNSVLGKEALETFFERFIAPAGVNHPNALKNVDQVLQRVQSIWNNRGFITPAEMAAELLAGSLPPGTLPETMEAVRAAELSRNQPDHTTGALGKEHSHLLPALAHLYAKTTGEHVLAIRGDFGGIGGTNAENLKRLQEQNKKLPEGRRKTDAQLEQQARVMTDDAMRLSCDTVRSVLRHFPGAKVVLSDRSGGDEANFLVVGVDPAMIPRLQAELRMEQEVNYARMALQDHRNPKDPDNRLRDGLNFAVAVIDMSKINPDTFEHDADRLINVEKYMIGLMRRGEIDETVEWNRLVAQGITDEADIQKGIEEARNNVAFIANALHAINPDPRYDDLRNGQPLNPGSGLAESSMLYAEKKLAEENALAAQGKPSYSFTNIPSMFDVKPGEDVPGAGPHSSREERRLAKAIHYLESKGIPLDTAQRHVLKIAAADLTKRDDSARAVMPAEMAWEIADTAARIGRHPVSSRFTDLSSETEENRPPHVVIAHHGGGNYTAKSGDVVFAVSLHGLAALNNMDHKKGDVVLQHVTEAIHDAVAKGGGEEVISSRVAQKLDELNKMDVADFLEERKVKVDRDDLAKKGITTFSSLKDAKVRECMVDGQKIEGRIGGLHAVVVSGVIGSSDAMDGTTLIDDVRTRADRKMENFREARLVEEFGPRKPEAMSISSAFVANQQEEKPASAPSQTRKRSYTQQGASL